MFESYCVDTTGCSVPTATQDPPTRRRGRRPIAPDRRLNRMLVVNVTKSDVKLIEQEARKLNLKVSATVRHLIKKGLGIDE